jgi:hypothetical protein
VSTYGIRYEGNMNDNVSTVEVTLQRLRYEVNYEWRVVNTFKVNGHGLFKGSFLYEVTKTLKNLARDSHLFLRRDSKRILFG